MRPGRIRQLPPERAFGRAAWADAGCAAFIQDDAHIFCTEDQVTGEAIALLANCCCRSTRDFSVFADVEIKFADRPEVRVGSDGGLGPGPSRI